jgi:hypothetical protein
MAKSIFDHKRLTSCPKGWYPEMVRLFKKALYRADIAGDDAIKLDKEWIKAYAAATGNSEGLSPVTGHLTGIYKTTKASGVKCKITDNNGLRLGGRSARGIVFKSQEQRDLGYKVVTDKHNRGLIRTTPDQFVDQVYRQDGNRYLAKAQTEDVHVQILIKGGRFFTELYSAIQNNKERGFISFLAEKTMKVDTDSGLLLF